MTNFTLGAFAALLEGKTVRGCNDPLDPESYLYNLDDVEEALGLNWRDLLIDFNERCDDTLRLEQSATESIQIDLIDSEGCLLGTLVGATGEQGQYLSHIDLHGQELADYGSFDLLALTSCYLDSKLDDRFYTWLTATVSAPCVNHDLFDLPDEDAVWINVKN